MSSLINLKKISALVISFILGISVLVSLHYAGNMVDSHRTSKKIALAFERGNLSSNPYNGRQSQFQTSQSLLGIDVFPDCQVYMSILTPKDWSMKEALVPSMFKVKGQKNYCDGLEKVISGEKTYTRTMKNRYWWGSKAFTSLALSQFTVFHTIQLLKIATLFLYLLITLLLYKLSSNIFYVFLPIIVYGFFFSGTMYFGGISLSLPYMWTLLCIVVLLLLTGRDRQAVTYQSFFILSGVGSSFIFLLDGHVVFMVPVYIVITYFIIAAQYSERRKYTLIAWYLSLYSVGLFGGIIADQLLSMIYLDPATVTDSFTKQLALRLSDSYPEWLTVKDQDFNLIDILKRLFVFYGRVCAYGSQGIYWALLSGAVAFAVGLLMAGWLSIRSKDSSPLLKQLPFLLAVFIFFLRFALLKNHSAIHVLFLCRYMFIPLSFGWAMLVLAVFDWRKS